MEGDSLSLSDIILYWLILKIGAHRFEMSVRPPGRKWLAKFSYYWKCIWLLSNNYSISLFHCYVTWLENCILLKGQIHCYEHDFKHFILLNFIVEKWVSTFYIVENFLLFNVMEVLASIFSILLKLIVVSLNNIKKSHWSIFCIETIKYTAQQYIIDKY